MNISQTFNILEVNKIKTNKLEYSYSNNIININKNNSHNIILDSSYSNYYLITEDSNMDIIIKLTSQKIGTKFRILITNIQKSLKISCTNNYHKFKGIIKINNNSGDINEETLNNNLKKNITQTTKNSDIIYIPNFKIGLYNGGYIDLLYTGDNNCNKQYNNEICYWLVNSELIGDINLPKTIILKSTCFLTIYIYTDIHNKTKIINVTTKDISGKVYYNNIDNNNIVIFYDIFYHINIFNVNDNEEVYNSENSLFKYDFKIKNTDFTSFTDFKIKNTDTDNFTSFTEFNNLKEIYDTDIEDYSNLNILQYEIVINTTEKIRGIFNFITINSYNNSDNINNNLSNLLFGYYNIFTEKNNNI